MCSKPREKSEKDINNEISAVIRQITASVTFLPLLEGACKSLQYNEKCIHVMYCYNNVFFFKYINESKKHIKIMLKQIK